MVMPDASISTVKGRSNCGRAKIGDVVMAVLSRSKVVCDSGVQRKASLRSREVRGVAIEALHEFPVEARKSQKGANVVVNNKNRWNTDSYHFLWTGRRVLK